MVIVTNVLACSIALTTILLCIYAAIYFIMFITGRFKNEKLNDKMLKCLYFMTMLPFVCSGFYVLSLLFLFNFTFGGLMAIIIFGFSLIIYPLFKGIRKIKDVDYFGGV